MPVGAADGDEEGIKVSRCSVASGAASGKKGRGEGGCLAGVGGAERGYPEHCTRRHCGKLCKLEAAANYFASV